jgi:hypothetical protein
MYLEKHPMLKNGRFGATYEQSNVFAYLAAVVNGKIKPAKDLSSFAVNSVVVEILSAAKESAKTGKTIYFSK